MNGKCPFVWKGKWGWMMAGKPKISVEVDQEKYDRYKEYAERDGLKLSQWVRRTLENAGPSVDTGANAAFKALDTAETRPLLPPAVRRIEPLPPAPQVQRSLPESKGLPPGHPCQFHAQGGGCKHRIMGGRPCRWPAPVATNCDAFVKLVY